jgi:hypothetical protein
MTAEHAADLQKQAVAAQNEINELLHAVDEADTTTSQRLVFTRASKGADFTVHRMGPPTVVPPAPADEVAGPTTEAGRQSQDLVRDQDMSTSVRETTETTDEQTGNHIKTVTMLDGSRQVITTEAG